MTVKGTTERRVQPALRTLVLVVCLIFSLAACAVGRDGGLEDRVSLTRDGVTMTFDRAEQRLAEKVLQIALEERVDLLSRFPRAEFQHLRVDLASSREDFAALSYGGVPDWGAGCAFDAERRIVVRPPQAARPAREQDCC